ncbi:uncharacterized protein LOC129569044 [Sitodiplosis mosellana]|uniref:uncharacterized protein LOC129569044 n=1 Tax=Sitodiplosis mosellana TaxID=263140 RepID=UPI002443CB4D|nr:uncharacterized protein LOC129569044 [Sitodiplosis mosellana]XP_055303427.1 uncharacterized protein LOC129569044 [Sitodiplosis mosellana]XP_055303433.1 uncharacterized protein LOC129569044 [Sitodiplosis mosellana]
MSCEAFTEHCQTLYQTILSAVENNVKLRPVSTDFSAILTSSINNFERVWQEMMKLDQHSNTATQEPTVEEPKDANNQSDSFGDIGNKDECVALNGDTNPKGLQSPDEMSGVESNKPNVLNEFDEVVRNAVSDIFNSTMKKQAENKHDACCDSEHSALYVEEDNENDGSTLNCGTATNEDGNDAPFIRSEVVTHHHQRTQHLVIQAVEGGLYQMGIREEVVTTTTTTMESRNESNEHDFVTPAKGEAEESPKKKPPSKRRFSMGDRLGKDDSESKPTPKRRCSMAERSERKAHCEEKPSREQKSRESNRMAQAKSESKHELKHGLKQASKRRSSMGDSDSRSGNDRSPAKLDQMTSQTSKLEQAMEKRRSNLRRTVSSRRDLQRQEKDNTNTKLNNTDKNMHAQNDLYRKLCALCDAKSQFMVRHYMKEHPDHEVLISRPSPKMAEQLLSQNDNFKVSNNKIKGICYFCEGEKTMTKRDFMDHLLIHTGEFLYSCDICHFGAKRMLDHKNCSGTPVSIYDENATDGSLAGYICSKCNFVQISQDRLRKHLVKQHKYHESNVIEGYHYKKVMLVASPNPIQSKIATEFEMVGPAKRFKCTICSKKCKNEQEFVQHFDEKHSEVFEYTCFCGELMKVDGIRLFGQYISSAHLCRHNEDLFQCKGVSDGNVCDDVYYSLKEVSNHLLNDHRDSRFRYQHVKRTTNAPTVVTEVTFRKIQCNICKVYLKVATFGSALKHFVKYHRTEEATDDDAIEVTAHLYKKVSHLAKKLKDVKTEYCNGGQVQITF